MNDYSVAIEVGVDDLDPDDPRLDELVDLLSADAGVVGAGHDRYTARLWVTADDAPAAGERAWRALAGLASKLSLPTSPVLRLEVHDEHELDAELARPNFPALLGTTEVTKMLGVSRQRLAELRRRPDFPAPMVDLAATPVWPRAAIEAFLERWDRRPGRPRLYATKEEAVTGGRDEARQEGTEIAVHSSTGTIKETTAATKRDPKARRATKQGQGRSGRFVGDKASTKTRRSR